MEFVVIAHDGTDEQALERRLAAREAHLALADKMKQAGKMLCGGAILDASDKMIGSVVIYNCESRAELNKLLSEDPYVNRGVWQKIEVQKFRLAPMYKSE